MKDSYLVQGNKIVEETDKLGSVWISGGYFAENVNNLKTYQIKSVISVINYDFEPPKYINHCRIPLEDTPTAEGRQHIFPAAKFI